MNRVGKRVHYYFNYSGAGVKASYPYGGGSNLLNGSDVAKGDSLPLGPWDLAIIEEK